MTHSAPFLEQQSLPTPPPTFHLRLQAHDGHGLALVDDAKERFY